MMIPLHGGHTTTSRDTMGAAPIFSALVALIIICLLIVAFYEAYF